MVRISELQWQQARPGHCTPLQPLHSTTAHWLKPSWEPTADLLARCALKKMKLWPHISPWHRSRSRRTERKNTISQINQEQLNPAMTLKLDWAYISPVHPQPPPAYILYLGHWIPRGRRSWCHTNPKGVCPKLNSLKSQCPPGLSRNYPKSILGEGGRLLPTLPWRPYLLLSGQPPQPKLLLTEPKLQAARRPPDSLAHIPQSAPPICLYWPHLTWKG